MKYRPEIDGLRALAVMPVILFHAGFELFSGGYVGVDVFFVISGYLITTIIISEIDQGNFSLISFYERRARRILPALFFVMLVSIPFAWIWMLPDALENFGQSLFANSFFANNILLYFTAGYWDLSAEFKPLLHTWSLAIEEQFYLFFPIFLISIWSIGKKRILLTIILLSIFSILLTEWGWRNNPDANFYLIPFRAWELFAGSIAAILVYKEGIRKNNLLSFIGIFSILFSIFLFDENTPFPSIYTLIPVIGTFLIIFYGSRETYAAKFLSIGLFVSIGLISYSAYLWHQPLFAFSRIYSQSSIEPLMQFILVILVIFFSVFTWRFIEKPFRDKSRISRSSIFISSLFGIFLFSSFGYFLHYTNGAPNRIFNETESYRSSHEIKTIRLPQRINIESIDRDTFDEKYKSIVIFGDSYAADIAYLLYEINPSLNIRIMREEGKYKVHDHPLFNPSDTICSSNLINKVTKKNVDSILFAYDEGFQIPCISSFIKEANNNSINLIFVGTKSFGENLNWLARLNKEDRKKLCQKPADSYLKIETRDSMLIPHENYVSFINLTGKDKCIPITNDDGELLSSDRKHLTIAGVEFYAPLFARNKNIKNIIE